MVTSSPAAMTPSRNGSTSGSPPSSPSILRDVCGDVTADASGDVDRGADLGELPEERGVQVRLALAAAGQLLAEFGVGLVRRAVADVRGDAVEADRPALGVEPADHQR